MSERTVATEEQLDYLEEMMNIGAGNAAAALSQFLHCNVELNLPVVSILPDDKIAPLFEESAQPVTCVRMLMLGEIRGHVLFVMSREHQSKLLQFMKTTLPKDFAKLARLDVTLLEEIANIITGVFLTALHDFSGVSICHTVPVMSLEMVSALINECTASQGGGEIVIIETEFTIQQTEIKAVLYLIPIIESLDRLLSSAAAARAEMGAV